ncbi:MAG: hypothetical protein ACYSWU_05935 [Planctomycetota bacterium]|jgi:hypothetical protein
MTSIMTHWVVALPAITIFLSAGGISRAADEGEDLLAGHPRFSYEDVEDIDAMEAALRKSLAQRSGYSFSRGWWQWDRLRCRYVDEGRKDPGALKILRAVFRGLILDRHAKLQAAGEDDLLYIFFTTLRGGKREEVLEIDGRRLLRDVHGGGTHGGWGGAARMRIYEELAKQDMLTQEEEDRFRQIVHQSFERHFIDFSTGYQHANNHAFGNVGGIAIALRLFPDVPQADEARTWIERIWKDFSDFGDWKEWTYYPYGPIFLHGMVDLAEERGAFETQRDLLYAVGRRCLGFVHGGGVRGNPNSYAPATSERERLDAVYRNPWQTCYYEVEQTARDGHFWYRMAKHLEDPEFLWAAEQIVLGGRPPDGVAPPEYVEAYDRRFAWFNQRGIKPKTPPGKSAVAYLSPLKHKIPERLYVCPGRGSGKPFASFFIYDDGGSHLNPPEVWGTLYEYCADGAKLLGSEGKYTDDIPGGSGAYDSLMVSKPDLPFPIDAGGPTRSGRLDRSALRAENRKEDSFGQYAFADYFGKGSRWTRQVVLTEEGCLIVRDVYRSGKATDGYQAGPCWQCKGEGQPPTHPLERNWFDAPAWDRAWWQKQKKRVLVCVHAADGQSYSVARHPTSADISRSIPTDGFAVSATVEAGEPKVFLSILVPHDATEKAETIVARVRTRVDKSGNCTATIGNVKVSINADGTWEVACSAEEEKDLGLQLAENPPMRVISKTPPAPAPITDTFEIREGFTLIETLREFRAVIKQDNHKIRMKPGVYRAKKVDPPTMAPIPRTKPNGGGKLPKNEQEHIFAVGGSNNHFDLRGVVFETPVSVQSKLSGKAHVADTWHINGANNTFEGGYFRNVVDRPYPQYRVTECEFEVCNDNNTF